MKNLISINRLTLVTCLFLAGCIWSAPVHAQKNKDKKGKKDKNNAGASGVHSQMSQIDSYYAEVYGNAATQELIGHYEEAIQLYSQCIKLNDKIAAPFYEIAEIFNKQGRYAEAANYCREAVKRDPTNKWYMLMYADTELELKNYKEVETTYLSLIKNYPGEYDFALELAEVYMLQKKYKEAIEVYNNLEKKTGVTPEISMQKQKLYQAMGKMQESLKELKGLINAFPGEPEYYGMLAELYMSMDKKEEARSAYEKVLELDPQNPIIHLALANYYQQAGSYDKAFTNLKMAFMNPDVSLDNKVKILLSYYELSMASARRKNEADTLLNIIQQVHPADARTWSIVGDFYMKDMKFEKARDAFAKTVKLSPDKFMVWDQLLRLDLALEDYEQLTKHADHAIELFPAQPGAHYYKGLGLMETGPYDEAVEALVNARDLSITDPIMLAQAKMALASAYFKNKQYDESYAILDEAVARNPKDALALNNYAFYLAEKGVQLEKAADMAQRAIQLAPGQPTYTDTYAWVLYKSGKYDEALVQIEKAIKNGGAKDAEVIEHYGDILYKSGNIESAVDQWRLASTMLKKVPEKLTQKIEQQRLIE